MGADQYSAKANIRWAPLIGGLIALYAVLQGAAMALNSTMGEYGLAVAAAVLALALLIKRLMFVASWRLSWRSLGLGWPHWRGLLVSVGLSAVMLGAAAAYLYVRGYEGLHPNAAWLALGIFAQAGFAEEVVFRGFLYGHLRRRRTFWRAALLAMIPFALVHLTMFATFPWPLALSALLLSIAVSFPLAYLYDLGGRTIWAPAIAHAVIQGVPKLVVGADALFPVVWMGAVLVILCLAFFFVSSSSDSRS